MALYLARLILNRECREVRADLGDCQKLHCRVMKAFPEDAGTRQSLGVLYRLDAPPTTRRLTLLVQSTQCPVWNHLPEQYLAPAEFGERNPDDDDLDEVLARIIDRQILRFRLRANPTRRVDGRRIGPEQDRLSGKRVTLLGEDEQLAWLLRKGEKSGFEVIEARIDRNDLRSTIGDNGLRVHAVERIVETIAGVKPARSSADRAPQRGSSRPHPLVFGSVLFDGLLRVTNPDQLRETLKCGIGPGKAYGFGLLSVAPVRR